MNSAPKSLLCVIVSAISLATLAGCANNDNVIQQNKLTFTRRQVQSLQNQLTDQQDAIAKLTESLQKAEKDKHAALANLRQAQAMLKNNEDKYTLANQALENLKSTAENDRKTFMDQIGLLTTQMGDLQARLDAEKARYQEMKTSISSNYAITATVVRQYNNQQTALVQKIACLENELALLKK